MNFNKFIPIIGLLLVTLALSCKNSQELTKQETNKINDKDLREILFNLQKVDFDFFYTKLAIEYKNSEKTQSFKASVKMKIDSAFSGTLSVGPIIGGTYLIDQDSIKSTDKIKKCYFTEDLSFVSSIMGVELKYDFFQDLLLGMPINLDESIKYKQIKDKDKQFYILSSHSKHKFQKIEKDKINLDNEKNNDIYIQYYFSPDSIDLVKMFIEIPGDSVSININYLESNLVEGNKVPQLTTISIVHPKDSISLELNYYKTKINQPKNIKFSVPDNYENCYK
jgi:hypothetical protein